MLRKLVIIRMTSRFSIMDLLAGTSIMAILASIAIPTFSQWIPNYQLKHAARDLYSSSQSAKITGVKQNAACAVVFDQGLTPGRYFICSGPGENGNWDCLPVMGADDVVLKTVNLKNYGNIVCGYGSGNAIDDVFGNGSPPADFITNATPPDIALFSPTGTLINPGGHQGRMCIYPIKGQAIL